MKISANGLATAPPGMTRGLVDATLSRTRGAAPSRRRPCGIGVAMSGQTAPIGKAVKPGEQIEVSVNLTAPNTSGDVQSYWKRQDDTGVFFGTYLTVVIKVAGPTATKADTPTPTTAP